MTTFTDLKCSCGHPAMDHGSDYGRAAATKCAVCPCLEFSHPDFPPKFKDARVHTTHGYVALSGKTAAVDALLRMVEVWASLPQSAESRENQLLEANNREVERRCKAEDRMNVARKALEALEAMSQRLTPRETQDGVRYDRTPCGCTTCLTVQAIIAFLVVDP